MIDFCSKNPTEILNYFYSIKIDDGEILELLFLDEDLENIGYKAFVDLAQLFFMKLLPPVKMDKATTLLRFKKLHTNLSFHANREKSSEKYGVQSDFFKIDKTSQFSFLYYYQQALNVCDFKSRKRVLNLGVNRGDEFEIIKEMLPKEIFNGMEFVGIDYCESAIEYAKERFADENMEFICHDINRLDELMLGKFDLIISIGTLQSSGINFNSTFMSLYQNMLESGGAVVLGFPNCRWIDGEMIYGAKAPNYSFSELSLMLKDIHFCKKYLQQKKYRVVVSGKEYLFLSGIKIGE